MSGGTAYRRWTKDALVNAWPGGPRVLRCLQCDARFTSQSRTNRVCARCLDDPQAPGDVFQGKLRTDALRSGWVE